MTREERLEEMLLAIRDRLDVGPMSIGPCKLFSVAITHVVCNGARWPQCGDIFEGNCIEVVPDEPVVMVTELVEEFDKLVAKHAGGSRG